MGVFERYLSLWIGLAIVAGWFLTLPALLPRFRFRASIC